MFVWQYQLCTLYMQGSFSLLNFAASESIQVWAHLTKTYVQIQGKWPEQTAVLYNESGDNEAVKPDSGFKNINRICTVFGWHWGNNTGQQKSACSHEASGEIGNVFTREFTPRKVAATIVYLSVNRALFTDKMSVEGSFYQENVPTKRRSSALCRQGTVDKQTKPVIAADIQKRLLLADHILYLSYASQIIDWRYFELLAFLRGCNQTWPIARDGCTRLSKIVH